MKGNLNVYPRAKIPTIQLVHFSNGSNLELFKSQYPDQSTEAPRNSDIGGHHLAFYVEDMEKAVAYLRAQGVEM